MTPEPTDADARAVQVTSLVDELIGLGFSRPSVDTDISDPETRRSLAVAAAF